MAIDGTYEGNFRDWYEKAKLLENGAALVSLSPEGGGSDPLPVDNGQSFDAFGRTEVSQITTQLDLKQSSGELVEFIDKETIGAGSIVYNSTSASTTMSVTSGTDRAICQTFQRTNYQTGKAKVLKMTFNGFQTETDVIKKVGYYSGGFVTPFETDIDGLWLESSDGFISTNVAMNGTVTKQLSTIWNGADVSDVDWSQNQLLKIEFAWLGVAAVKWSLFRSGAWVVINTNLFDNTTINPYILRPNQPFKWEVISTGGSGSMTFICASAETEGALTQLGKVKGVDRGSDHQNANNTSNIYANIGIALDETKSLSFMSTVIDIISGTAVALTNDAYVWRLYRNPTISGASLSWNSVSNSAVKYFEGADNNLITSGEFISSGYVSQRGSSNLGVDNSIKLGIDINGNPDVFVIAIQPLGANLDILCSINFRELD